MSLEQYFELTESAAALIVQPKCIGGAFAEEASRGVWGEILELVDEKKTHVIVDLGNLNFFGSTMLDFVATVNKRARKIDKKVALSKLSATGREVLEIARFDQFLEIYESNEDALAALS